MTREASGHAIELAPSAAPTLFGTSDPRQVIARATEIADLLATVVRERGLARRFGDAEREFYELPAWQVLASQLGVTAAVEWTRRIDDGWEARAEVRTLDGRALGAAEGMCLRSEPNFRRQSEHAIRAMAQVRAIRRAYQAVLGFIPALAGLDLSNPDAPATRKQVGTLHAIARARGWTHEDSHQRAGVESFNECTREQAAELIDAWSELEPEAIPAESPDEASGLNLDELWERAVDRYGSKVRVLRAYVERHGAGSGISAGDLTEGELWELLHDDGRVPTVEGPGRGAIPGPGDEHGEA